MAVDQLAQSGAGARSAEGGESAMRELAHAIRDLAMAIRDSAAFTELEFVPCGEVAQVDGSDEPCSRGESLPLVPAPRSGEPDTGTLCRPGGCACSEPDDGQGRHARRENDGVRAADATVADVGAVDDAGAAQCCQSAEAGAR